VASSFKSSSYSFGSSSVVSLCGAAAASCSSTGDSGGDDSLVSVGEGIVNYAMAIGVDWVTDDERVKE
jgi:hypothetical protein